ncbi:TspO/MBR family protein [Methylobrevis albus]|nr:TspO/MBR family protein [Methylobrevis albus]
MSEANRSLVALGIALAICYAAAAIGGLVTAPAIPGWYETLRKPPFNPPNGVFGPVWTVLYTMMALAVWLVWKAPAPAPQRRLAFLAFAVQLVLNVAWSVVFFGLQSPWGGVLVIIALIAAVVGTMFAFAPISRNAALLLAPYLAWIAFASVLNLWIAALN